MMPWNSTWPNGAVSVKQNRPTGQQNTSYIETTMNIDHYWNIGSNYDGHHKFVQMPNQASDIPLAGAMDGAIYIKTVSASNPRVEGFYRNVNGIYQFIPSFQTGSVSIPSSTYVTVATVPAHSYGQIFMFTDNDDQNMSFGFFKSGATLTQSYACTTQFAGSSDPVTNLKFGNDDQASALTIRARRQNGPSATYLYRIVYWGI